MMVPTKWLICYLLLSLETYGEKIKDEDRPYEFSFTIDSEQHRYEKKDINGIIQGEFGFITADGVYHVTVYATDENGNFKIISMKNIKISERLDRINRTGLPPIPELQHRTSSPVQLYEPRTVPTTTRVTAKPLPEFITASTVRVGCGGCGIITTPSSLSEFFKARTKKVENKSIEYNKPIIDSLIKTKERDFVHKPNALSINPTTSYLVTTSPRNIQSTSSFKTNSPIVQSVHNNLNPLRKLQVEDVNFKPNPVLSQSITPLRQPAQYSRDVSSKANIDNALSINPTTSYLVTTSPRNIQSTASFKTDSPIEQSVHNNLNPLPKLQVEDVNLKPNPVLSQSITPLRQPAQYSLDVSSKAKIDNGLIKIPGNNPILIQDKYPNMVEGLPNGITKEDISDLLYKFNYTVGFHGHYEKGWRNGTKVGGYFVNGRDGYSRIVTYVADERGYRPKFRLVRLGLDSIGTPKEDTEKSFGLEHFEFVWYPIK